MRWLKQRGVSRHNRWVDTSFCFVAAAASAMWSERAPARAAVAPVASPSPTPQPDPCGGSDRLLATANRPTIGYSACAVKPQTVVFELGYQNEVEGTQQQGAVESQWPQAFTRVGIAQRFEVDVIGPNYEALRSYAPQESADKYGVDDSGLGFKYEFVQVDRWTLAVDGLYTSPSGSKFLTAGSASYTGNFDASYALSPATAIGTTIAVESTGQLVDGRHAGYGVTQPSLSMTTQIPNEYQFYAEYVAVSKIAADRGARTFTDFGVQKLLGTRTELDLEYGHAFTAVPSLKFNYVGAGTVIQLW